MVGVGLGQENESKKDCSLDGVEQAKIDYETKGILNGIYTFV